MTARRLVPAVVLLGALLLQVAWVLVVPPLYSTTTPAPNGLEMVACLLLWTSLLSLDVGPSAGDRLAVGCAAVGAGLLVTRRSVGPLVPLLVAGAGWGLAQLLTCLTELRIELARPVSAGDPGWSHGPTTLVVVVAVLGIAALVSAPLSPTGSAPAGPSTAPRRRGALGPPVAQGVT